MIDRKIVRYKSCKVCGAEFGITAHQAAKIYCTECGQQVKKLKDQEYRQTHKEQKRRYQQKHRKPKRTIAKCERCGQEFIYGKCGRKPTLCIDCLINSDNAAERTRGYIRRDYSIE